MRILFLCILPFLLFSEEAHDYFVKAEKHRTLGHFSEAILWYRERLHFPEEQDEVWLSKYMLGVCYEKTGDWDSALSWYLEAFQSKPFCADPLSDIAVHYRFEGKNDLAYLFANHGKKISPFDLRFDSELAISSYYTPFKQDGLLAANRLILAKNLQGNLKEQTYRNILYYVSPLADARFQKIDCSLPLISEGLEERYHPMNPSLTRWKNGYQVICRSVNYTQMGAKHFQTSDPSGVFRTRNFLLYYDEDFNLVSQKEIIENLPRKRTPHFNVEGLEDCRIFSHQDALWFSCTTLDTNSGTPQISLCKLGEESQDEVIYVEKLIPLQGPNPKRCEKNWLPFSLFNEIYAVYSCGPFVLNKPNLETGAWNPIFQDDQLLDFSSFRGSAAPIEFDQGYLMLVHEVVFLYDYQRAYLHRFVQLDSNFKVTHISKPFIFNHVGIEFCPSMALNHKGNELILAVGIEDREAFLCFLEVDRVKSILEPL